jgi:Domain of unknown function (DUF4405)
LEIGGKKKIKEIMSTKSNLILDLGMFGIFMVVANPHMTGTTIHEWLALSLAGTALTHILVHWKWIFSVAKGFFKKLWHQSRLNFVVNTLFLITMTGSFISGLMISKSVMPSVGITLDVSRSWRMIHNMMSNASLAVLALHIALHWKWVVTNIGRYITNAVGNVFQRSTRKVLAMQSVQVENE